MARKEITWDKVVLGCTILIFVIILFKALFWVSVILLIFGIIWLVMNFISQDYENTWIPAIIVCGAIILGIISYGIGYEFEKTELGKPLVEGATIVVDTNNQIEETKENITKELVKSLNRIT